MIKFIVAGLWLCAVSIGAVIYSFQVAGAKATAEPAAALLGGLDYVKTDVLSVPVLRRGGVVGYFLTRLVYTVDPVEIKELSVPAPTLINDQVYTYLFTNPNIDFSQIDTLDLDTFRNGLRDSINKRIGKDMIHDIMIEQIDFLSKSEIRDNALRRQDRAGRAEGGKGRSGRRACRGKRPLTKVAGAACNAASSPRPAPDPLTSGHPLTL